MNKLANEIVDILIETTFSDEDMGRFGELAAYTFLWRQDGVNEGSYRLKFTLPYHSASGDIYLYVVPHGVSDSHDRKRINYSVDVSAAGQNRGNVTANTRLNTLEIKWAGIEELKNKFEDWIRGPLTQLITGRRLSTPTLVAANRKFAKSIGYWDNTPSKATPEEISS